ncbi:hypothetical protein V8F33_009488 [Rhypophila sp. PSN 637]
MAKTREGAQRQPLTQLQYFARAAKTLEMLNEENRAWQEKRAYNPIGQVKPVCSTKPAEEPEDEDIVMEDYEPETINSSEDEDVVMEDYKPELEIVTVSLTRDFDYMTASEQIQQLQEQELNQRRPETGNWKYKLASLFIKYGPPNESTVLPEPLFLTPLDFFLKGLDAFVYPDDIARPVLSAIALILYDQACSGQAPSTRSATTTFNNLPQPPRSSQEQLELSNAFKHLLEHMFLIDYHDQLYEFGSHFPPSLGVLGMANYLLLTSGELSRHDYSPSRQTANLPPEIALILYNYHTHRTERTLYPRVDGKEKDDPKLTGYTGILRELIADVPTKGPDRLLRKLSIDIQIFSHTHYVDDFRIRHLPHSERRVPASAIQSAAKACAKKYLLPLKEELPQWAAQSLCIPMVAKLEITTPVFYKTHRDGYTIAEKTSIQKKTWFSRPYYMGIPPMGPKRRGFVTFDTRLVNGNTTSPTVKKKRFGEMFEYTDEQLGRKWRSAKEFARGWNDAHKKLAAESECGPGCCSASRTKRSSPSCRGITPTRLVSCIQIGMDHLSFEMPSLLRYSS